MSSRGVRHKGSVYSNVAARGRVARLEIMRRAAACHKVPVNFPEHHACEQRQIANCWASGDALLASVASWPTRTIEEFRRARKGGRVRVGPVRALASPIWRQFRVNEHASLDPVNFASITRRVVLSTSYQYVQPALGLSTNV